MHVAIKLQSWSRHMEHWFFFSKKVTAPLPPENVDYPRPKCRASFGSGELRKVIIVCSSCVTWKHSAKNRSDMGCVPEFLTYIIVHRPLNEQHLAGSNRRDICVCLTQFMLPDLNGTKDMF